MERYRSVRDARGWLILLLVVLMALPATVLAQNADARREAFQSMPGTTPDFWRDAEEGVSGRTQSNSPGADTLIMVEGEGWREIRNQ